MVDTPPSRPAPASAGVRIRRHPVTVPGARARKRWLGFGVLILGVLLAAASVFAPQLQVSTFRIRGGSEVVRTEVESLTRAFITEHAVFGGRPRLFLVPRELLARHLTASVPPLATVQILRRIPSTLELHLQEKVPVAFLDISGRTYALDGAGTIIAEVPLEEASGRDLPLIRDQETSIPVRPGETVLSPRLMEIFHEVVVKLPEHLSVSVRELLIPAIGSQEVHVRTTGGWLLLLDGERPLDHQLRSFEQVVSEELKPDELTRLEYVDLRIQGKVYYRLRPRGSRPQQSPP